VTDECSEVLVARQPIFDERLNVVGYELLFRGGEAGDAIIDSPDGATAAVLLNSLTEIGLDSLVGNKPAWVNLSREFVLAGLAQALPAERVVLEILEDQVVDEELVRAIRDLKRHGYRIALDDFQYSVEIDPLLPLADVIKLDLLALGRDGLGRELGLVKPHGAIVLAEKVETREEFKHCAAVGCELFQGFFFCRPELVRGRRIDANRLALLELLAALEDPGADLRVLEGMITRDLGLSYRLLRYINSAFFGMRQQVRSVGHALAMLGLENLKQWAALSVFASVDGKPAELTVTALIRARFCQLTGPQSAPSGELFTLGLFSVIDALMDTPISDVLEKIPFAPDLRNALLTHSGEKGQLLECVIALEAGDFDRARAIVPSAGEFYLHSLTWASQAAEPMFAGPSLGNGESAPTALAFERERTCQG
jgi:EAL and modified HD-GYP domain-containing signal transduction protein